MRFKYEAVSKTPKELDPFTVYVNKEFEVASFLCACGCGHKVTLLVPDGHSVENNGGFATVYPSVGVWDAPCKSHYYITGGRVDWCSSWSDEFIKKSMLRQRQRHEHKSWEMGQPWYRRLWMRVRNVFRRKK